MLLFCVWLVLFSIMPLRFANLFHVATINFLFFLVSGHITLNGCIPYSLQFFFFFSLQMDICFFFFQLGAILCTTAYEHSHKILCGYVFNYLEHSAVLMLTTQSQVVSFTG